MLGTSGTSNIFGTSGATNSLFSANKTAVAPYTGFGQTRFGTPGFDGFKTSTIGATSATVPAFSFGANLSQSTPISTFGISNDPLKAKTVPSLGLGGIDVNQVGVGLADGTGYNASKTARDMTIQPELESSREDLKNYMKQQKAIREEICCVSPKNLNKTQEETCALRQMLIGISSGLQKKLAASAALKKEIIQELKNSEIAQRTKDTPSSLQYDNNFPSEYFKELIQQFEHQTQLYRMQINQTELFVSALSQPLKFTPQDFMQTLSKLHEIFVSLAAQLQVTHETVKAQKEQLRQYRRSCGLPTGHLNLDNKSLNFRKIQSIPIGPSPFSYKSSTTLASTLGK